MQAKSKVARIFLLALMVSLVLGACGGGTSGKTWFNLPSIPVRLQENGAASVFGFNIGAILQPAQIELLRSANIQKAEVRVGYNGIFILANGQELPYLSWDQASAATLQEVVRRMPTIPNNNLIANLLPWLRTFGVGVILDVPPASGQAAVDAPRWKGETTVAPAGDTPTTIGPINISSLAFDETGAASISGVPVANLEQALGMSLPLALDANTLALLDSLGVENVTVSTQPNGVNLTMNGQPLPGIAYDAERLAVAQQYVGPLTGNNPMVADLLTKLPGAQIDAAVSFTGEPMGQTSLTNIPVAINEDGSLAVHGFNVPGATIPPDLLSSLQSSGVQNLGVAVGGGGATLIADGQPLPAITWTPEALQALVPLAGVDPALVGTVMDIVGEEGVSANVTLPGAEAGAPGTIPPPAEVAFQPAELGDMAPPTIILKTTVDSSGQMQVVGGITAEELGEFGISAPVLPANVMDILTGLNAQEVRLTTDPNKLTLSLDGTEALGVGFDEAALRKTLVLAQPFLADTVLADPGVAAIVDQVILPIAPAAELDITVNMQ